MKLNLSLIAAALIALTDAAAVSEAKAVCKNLGVTSHLSDGARLCADHPLGKTRDPENTSMAPFTADEVWGDKKQSLPRDPKHLLTGRGKEDCWTRSAYGCTNGYCWSAKCSPPGQGWWCWTAQGDGSGNWNTCSVWSDCDPNASCGKDCSVRSKSCGCSC